MNKRVSLDVYGNVIVSSFMFAIFPYVAKIFIRYSTTQRKIAIDLSFLDGHILVQFFCLDSPCVFSDAVTIVVVKSCKHT